jgi:hypothetical protein
MLTDGEPKTEDLKIVPWRGSCVDRGEALNYGAARWGWTRKIDFGVSKSLGGKRIAGAYHAPLAGAYGRGWLADPCSMILEHAIRAAQRVEDEAEKAWKARRREEKAQLYQLEKDARAKRPGRARW